MTEHRTHTTPPRRRPNREVVALLRAAPAQSVTFRTDAELIVDVDGKPLAVGSVATNGLMLSPSLEDLGWTEAEWNDPSVTE